MGRYFNSMSTHSLDDFPHAEPVEVCGKSAAPIFQTAPIEERSTAE
jgi:hypothetical protein